MTTFSVFFLSFLLTSPLVWSQDLSNTTPTYQWLTQVDLPTVTSGDLNYNDLTIAIATDPQGNVYTLSFGKGVDKRDADGNLLKAGFISASQLDSPRDLAIDDRGYIYIADYIAAGDTFLDDGKLRVFDPDGNYLPNETIFTSFYRPLGLDIIGDKIYVAEYYDGLQGPEKGSTFSRIRIYDKVTKTVLKENKQAVVVPLRIAVDSYENIYVSQAGNNDPSVTVFNSSLQVTGELPGIVSPGSVLVDDFDFIHVIEYGNRIDFSDFINFENLAFGDILNISEEMMLGIKNEEFFVKVYRTDNTLAGTLLDHVDFPVDLAMSTCEKFYIDNTTIFGDYFPLFGYTPSRLEFDLEVYKRNPTFDAAEAPEITCVGNIEVEPAPGKNYAVVDFPVAEATDNCSVSVTQTKGLASGSQFPVGGNIIEFTATDAAGNIATCSFSIIVNGSDLSPQFADCPADMKFSGEPGKCGAIVTFETPVATDESGSVEVNQIIGLPSGSLFPVGDTQVNFQAIDGQGNTSNCSFTVSVSDAEAPVIDCPENLVFPVDFGATGRIVEYAAPVAADNCSGLSVEQTAGLPSGSNFPVGVTENIFLVTDASDNTASCSFTITIEENADTEDPVITCPAGFSVSSTSEACGAMVYYSVPEATDNSREVSLEHIAGPAPGEFFEIGATTVTYRAVDAAGNSVSCSFVITVNDSNAPIIENCPGDQQEIISTEEFILSDYRNQLTVTDCSGNIVITQTPQPGTHVSETTLIKIIAEDGAGNSSAECVFQVLIQKEALQITSCPSGKTEQISGNCSFILPDYSSEVSTNHSSQIIQTPLPGTEVSADINVIFTATDGNGNTATCETSVRLEDTKIPTISCPADKEFTFDPAAGFTIPDFTAEVVAEDNCSFQMVQEPAPGTVIFATQDVVFTATDVSGNQNSCSFSLLLTEEVQPAVQITSCPASKTLDLNSNCTAEIPDLTGEISTSISAEIVQSPVAGTSVTENTSVVITVTDANGNQDMCTVQAVVQDLTPPTISCPADKEFAFDPADGFTIPDFTSEVVAEDNCSFQVFQEPIPGTVIFATQEVLFRATDVSGNQNSCSFSLLLTEEVQPAVQITSCPPSKTLDLNSNCTAEIPDLSGEISTSISAEIVQSPAAGTPVTENTSITITVTDANGNQDMCTVQVMVQDVTPPTISCPADKEFTFDPADGFMVPDFTAEVVAEDNCNFQVVQEPAPGTVIFASQDVLFTATDASGNQSSCSFSLLLTEEVQPAVQITSCPPSKTLNLSSDCAAIIPDLTGEISTSISAEIIQSPVAGTPVTENASVIITVTDANGNQDTCTVQIVVQDVTPPMITCPADKEFTFDPAAGFTIPDFTAEVVAEDNCSFQVVQEPAPGTVIFATQDVVFTATDVSGNQSSCSYSLLLTEEVQPAVQITSCPPSKTLNLSSDCAAIIPDLTGEISTSISAEIVQSPAAGTPVTENTSVVIRVTDANGNQDTCTVLISVHDVTPPGLSCSGDISAKWDSAEGYILPDYTSKVTVEDNCGVNTIIQQPSAGTLISENSSEITITATDNSGNSASCSFWLHLSEEELLEITCPGSRQGELSTNCDYIIPDFTSLAGVNFANALITQEPQPGSILYSDSQITLTATLEGKTASCTFELNLKDNQSPEVKCVNSPVFKLDSNGIVNITPENIDAGSTDNCGIVSRSLSKSAFTTADLGEQKIVLTVVDASGNESTCESIVKIEAFEENVSEIQCIETITLELDEDRTAVIDPEALHTGGSGSIQFTLSKEQFNCGDIGEQMILFSYSTPSEEGSCQIKIIVEDPGGYCSLIVDEPTDPVPFVILYPNPGDGIVKIYTSSDIILNRAEIFDMRGRFLFAKDLPENSSNLYSVDLTMYQAGVYTIKLKGEDSEYIRRAIIRND